MTRALSRKSVLLAGFYLGNFLSVEGQSLFVTENQILSISGEAVMTFQGGVINQGAVLNQGVLRVGGDWTNLQTYAGEGSVELIGESDQQIHHSNQSLATLLVNGVGNKQLQSPLTVTNRLVLRQGWIEATPENVLKLTSATSVEEASVSSYVIGPLQYPGTGYRFFPIGTETSFCPLILEEVKGVNPTLRAQVQAPNLNLVPGDRLERVSEQKYWKLEQMEGTFDGSLVTLSVNSEDEFPDLFGVVVAQAELPESTFSSLGQSARQGTNDDGWITSRVPATQSILALGLTSEFSLENSVEVPSAFSPEAPNPENQRLKVYAVNLEPTNFSFIIFNRWGQIVYQTDVLAEALSQGWNGDHYQTNEPVPVGVYHYVLRGAFETSQSVEKTGAITLFR